MKHAIFILTLLLLASCTPVTVERGDSVYVTYTGKYANGSVFDTNDPALKLDFPDFPAERFTPMLVSIGSGQVIPGFENALIGMREGEEKTVTIRSAQAYGGYNPDKIFSLPKQTTYARQERVLRTVPASLSTLKKDLGESAVVGTIFETENFIFNITAMNRTHATLYLLAPRSDPVQLQNVPWRSRLIDESDDALTYEAMVKDGDKVRDGQGVYSVQIEESKVVLTSAFEEGDRVSGPDGIGYVTDVTIDRVILNFNHPLAGYDLVFTLRVDTVEPRSTA